EPPARAPAGDRRRPRPQRRAGDHGRVGPRRSGLAAVAPPLDARLGGADAGRVRLPYDEAGEGPAVVLLHAGVADRRMWAAHLEPLAAAGYRAIAPDLPGFGDAPMPAAYTEWLDVLETLDTLGVERAVLVGNSFGGAMALRVAA